METTKIGVVGAGVMGSEIAQVFAAAGHDVLLVDIEQRFVDKGLEHLANICARRVKRGAMTQEEADAIVARVRGDLSMDSLSDRDLVIEVVPEVMSIKEDVWKKIDAAAPAGALLASNTSGLSISAMADLTGRPSDVLGMHFFNPASVMKLVEVIRGSSTSDEVLDRAVSIVSAVGKVPVRVMECPGFLVNRVLVRALAEAYRLADEIGASKSSADEAVAADAAPMGAFALGDLIGLDTTRHVQSDLLAAYGDRFEAGTTLAAHVDAGELGQKSGTGFVTGQDPDAADDNGPAIAERYYLGAFDEACRCIEEDIAAIPDIDLALKLGAGWAMGPLEWADKQGLADVKARLEALAAAAGDRFAPRTPLLERVESGEPFIS